MRLNINNIFIDCVCDGFLSKTLSMENNFTPVALSHFVHRISHRSRNRHADSDYRISIKNQNQLCAVPRPAAPKTGFVPTLYLPHQNRLCIGTKPAFPFWINISTVSEVKCDCQGLGLVARIEASILVFDTKQVLYWPVLGQIQFCNFDRRCKTCLDTQPVLYQSRFSSLTTIGSGNG